MQQSVRAMQSRRRHRFPKCPTSGLSRFGERKDARLAMEASQRLRSRAAIGGGSTTWAEVTAFKCPTCRGFHLTRRANA